MRRFLPLLVFLTFSLIIVSTLDYVVSMPPACMKKSFEFGGCSGKNTLKKFKIKGKLPSCLSIEPHTCNGAKLEVENLCPKAVQIYIENEKIADTYTYLSYTQKPDGQVVKESKPSYPPQNQKYVLICPKWKCRWCSI